MPSSTNEKLREQVFNIVSTTPVLDIHTHLYPPSFDRLYMAGIDELVTYHYLIAELFRSSNISPADFWNMSKPQQADVIWETLFVRNTPISEAARGVVHVLRAFGLDPAASNLNRAREFFASRNREDHIRQVFELAGVSEVVMTNDAFDEVEAECWQEGAARHPRFHAVLRLDPLLNSWDLARERLTALGYNVAEIASHSIREVRRFLDDWIARLKPLYMAVSLPPDFKYPEASNRSDLIAKLILPACLDHNLPFATMIGVRKRVNPPLRDAGDGVGHADIASVERMCLEHPDNRFLVTMLSRENQHELCVAARKFSNLMPFGCWWFLNNPSIVSEITRERLEMLGSSFIPQHSDARILEQVIYKWAHSRRVIADALTETYEALERDGWQVTTEHIRRDVERMFQSNFREWVGLPAAESRPETVTKRF